jgi:hypothetical protein
VLTLSDWHPNAEGHRLLPEALWEKLRDAQAHEGR